MRRRFVTFDVFTARRFAGNQSEVDRVAAALSPYYRQMYLRAAGQPVGMNRWVGDAAKVSQHG